MFQMSYGFGWTISLSSISLADSDLTNDITGKPISNQQHREQLSNCLITSGVNDPLLFRSSIAKQGSSFSKKVSVACSHESVWSLMMKRLCSKIAWTWLDS